MALSSFAAGAMVVGGAGIAQACDNGSQASGTSEAGTVQSVNGNVITILDRSGRTDTVDTDNNTVFETEGGSPASPSGVANGDFLWAFGSMQSDGSLMAAKVKYGPASQSNTSQSNTSQSNTSQSNTSQSNTSQSQSGQSSSFQAQPSSQSQQSSSSNSNGDDDDSGSGGSHHHHHHHRS